MSAGEKLHGSNVRLEGYLKLLDNPIYLGLADTAYITTSLSSNSLEITNLFGDIDINSPNIYLNTNLILSPGLFKYQANYWGLYDNRTLVDKEYVDSLISIVTADNGLTKTLSNIQLGGAILQNTDITGGGLYDLNIGTNLSRLNTIGLYSKTQTALQNIGGIETAQVVLNTAGTSMSFSGTTTFGNTGTSTISLVGSSGVNSGIIMQTSPTSGVTNYFRMTILDKPVTNNGTNNRFIIQDDANSKGIVYWGDYSANFTDESLITKRYLLDQLSLVGVSYWDLNTAGELVLNLGVPGPVMPHTTSIVDLGSSSYKWQDLYLSGSIDKVTVNNAYTLPNVDGTNGQVLKTNGAGVVTWQTVIGGTGNLADLNDVTFTTGTPVIGDILVFNGTDWEARELPVTFNVSGAINSKKATNQYVESDDTGIFLSPFILPENAILKYMSASCAVADTWTAEVHVNGTLFTGATVTVTAAKKAYIKFTTTLSFAAGDEIQLYLNGTNIDKPRINATFVSVP